MSTQKESLKKLPGFTHAPASPQKVCGENETKKQRNKKKQCTCKNVIDGRKHFIGCSQKTGENDWDKLRKGQQFWTQ